MERDKEKRNPTRRSINRNVKERLALCSPSMNDVVAVETRNHFFERDTICQALVCY